MDVLHQDMERVTAFYHNNGYLDAKVGEPTVEHQDDGLHISFPGEEGPRYRLGTVDLRGDLVKDKNEMLRSLKIRDEEYLNRQTMREDIVRLTDLYAEQGYAYSSSVAPVVMMSSTSAIE